MSDSIDMRKPRRHSLTALALTALMLALPLTGCQGPTLKKSMQALSFSNLKKPFSTRSQSPDKDDDFNEGSTTVKTSLLVDYPTFAGLSGVKLQGVGLVVGLNGTGGDPPPSQYRTALLDDLRRREVPRPNELIASPNTALVIVTAILPPLMRKGETFDIDIRVDGDSASSLNGGYLMETILSETTMVPGQGNMKGHIVAKAKGPVLISTGEGKSEDLTGVLRRGKVLGGARSLIDRDMAVYLKSDFRNFRNVTRIADRIGTRFYAYSEHGAREKLTKAQTDQRILLKVHPRYKENYPRYMRVIQSIAFRESPVEQRVRMQRLEKEILIPEKAEKASLQLEAIGTEAVSILKTGLTSPHLECRFHAAMALAYLEEADGLEVLQEAALKERAFRVFAYASMSALDDPRTHLGLRDLMSVQVTADGKTFDSAETRYGAFRALWTLDKSDPFIDGEHVNKEFWLHPLRTTGDPMVHITHYKRAEIVLFGHDQEFVTPLALRAGNHIMVTCRPGQEKITVAKFVAGRNDERREVSRRVADVIRAVAELEGSYPDIAQLLVQADRQHNLPGRFEIDALPKSGRVYYRDGNKSDETRVGRSLQSPNIFEQSSEGEPEDEPLSGEQSEPLLDASETPGKASLVDARTAKLDAKKSFALWPWAKKDKAE